MLPGFGTNSIGDVDPLDVMPALHELGYRSLAITLDHHTLHPGAADRAARIGVRHRDGRPASPRPA